LRRIHEVWKPLLDRKVWATAKQWNRTTKQPFKEKYSQMTLESPDYQLVMSWAEGILSLPSAAIARP